MADRLYVANLAFFLEYDDPTDTPEVEFELFKIAFQVKETIHYDRINGGNFEDLEQQNYNETVMTVLFGKNFIESVYRLNELREFNPYIIIGFTDIETEWMPTKTELATTVKYRLLQDIQQQGKINVRL